MIFYLLLAGVLAFCVFYSWMKYRHGYWKRYGVYSPPSHWFFGNVKDAICQRKSMGYVLGELHNKAREEDDVIGIYMVHMPFLLIRNPEIIKSVLIRDFHVFSNRYFAPNIKNDPISSKNLFSIHNPEWKYLRMKMSPVFTSGKLRKLFELMQANADNMRRYLEGQFENETESRTILTRDVCCRYTTDVIASVAFGISVNSFEDPEPNFYTRCRKLKQPNALEALQFLVIFFFPSSTKIFKQGLLGWSKSFFSELFWDSMNSREKSGRKRGDLVDYLLELKNEAQDADFKFEGDVLLAQSTIFFIAGLESSASLMSFALCEMAKNPEIQDRLRREINRELDERGMTYDSVLGMKYLHQVISETLRLYPSASFIDRVASEDYELPGKDFVIKKGTAVYVSLAGIHMDPRFYEEPEKFDPDRFEDQSKIESCTYLPFGDGPRNCIGLRVGTLMSSVGLITILRDYEILLDPMHKPAADPASIFITPPENLTLKFKKIERN